MNQKTRGGCDPFAHRRRWTGRPGAAPTATSGFTLIELAVVLGVVVLLLGGLLAPLATQLEVRKNREAERSLRDVRQVLLGYAAVNGRLPCPDFDGDGVEGVQGPPASTSCDEFPPGSNQFPGYANGPLPWRTLGLPPADTWGRLYVYAVSTEFTHPSIPGASAAPNLLDLGDTGTLTVYTRGDDPTTPGPPETKVRIDLVVDAPAVVVSLGANGSGGVSFTGNPLAAPPAGTDEVENVNGDAIFVTRLHTRGSAPCSDAPTSAQPLCEFDDLVTWVAGARVLGELVSAQRLP